MKTKAISMAAVLFALLLSFHISAQVDFSDGSWEQIKEKAAAQDKLIFVDAYAVWCGPCKWMDANVFPNKRVGSYFNENFINYKFDMEKGEGPAFAKKFGVRNYPTYLFITPEGKVVHRVSGSRPVEQFIEVGKTAVSKQ